MSKISENEVRHLAALSSIAIADDEIEAMTTDIDTIVNYVTALGRLDTTGIEPTYQVTGLSNISREDVVEKPQLQPEQLLNLAPEYLENQIKVPKVL